MFASFAIFCLLVSCRLLAGSFLSALASSLTESNHCDSLIPTIIHFSYSLTHSLTHSLNYSVLDNCAKPLRVEHPDQQEVEEVVVAAIIIVRIKEDIDQGKGN